MHPAPGTLIRTALVLSLALPALAQDKPASLDAQLAELRKRTHVPGLAAAVVREGKIVALGASGLRELGKPEPLLADDRFVIGSCTKHMTRMLFARLIQAGKVAPESKLPVLLPGVKMREEYGQATLADLLRHTAGLPSYERINRKLTPIVFELQGTPMERRSRFAEHVLQESPAGRVGQDFVYSNAAFSILGNIAERALGKPWEELMAAEVFVPLHMDSAVIGLSAAEKLGPMPKGHERTPKGVVVAQDSPPVEGLFAPAGGVVLSIGDFARFAIAEAAAEHGECGEYLGKEACAKLAGLRARDAGPEGEVFLGGQGTFTAGIAVWPSLGFGVVVCTNTGDSDEVCEAAVDALRAAFAPEIKARKRMRFGGPGPEGPKGK